MSTTTLRWTLRFSSARVLLLLPYTIVIGVAHVGDLQAQATTFALDSVCGLGDPAAALRACNSLLSIDPTRDTIHLDRGNLYVNRGNAYDKLGQPDKALADYDRALALNPFDAHALRNKGVTFYRMHLLNEALHEFEAATRADPRYADAWSSRADALTAVADTAAEPVPLAEQAVLFYDRALALGSLDEDGKLTAYYGRGFLNYHLHHFTDAVSDFTSAIRLRPSTTTYLARATSYADGGDLVLAMKDIDSAARLTKTPADSEGVRSTRDYITRKRR